MKLSSSNIKKFLIFSETKAFLTFQETEIPPKKIPNISGNGTFLYFRREFAKPENQTTLLITNY